MRIDRARMLGLAAGSATAAVLLLVAGCNSTAATYTGELSTEGIIARLPAPAASPTGDAYEAAPAPPVRVVTEAEARAGVADVVVLAGAPESIAPAEAATGDGGEPVASGGLSASDGRTVVDAFLVDSMVGQINGRPVYASEFFSRMDARLRAEAQRLPTREWLVLARQLISQELRARVRDELLLAEFEASLKPEQRVGLLEFLRQIREDVIREQRGSEMLARQAIEENEGLSIEQKVRQRRDQALISQQLREKVLNRTYVSWRDVVQAWEREPERFAPRGKARLRMIWVDANDGERRERVAAALGSGLEFAVVAAENSEWNPSEGGLHEVALDKPTYAESTIFGPAVLNEQARGLKPGETVGPFEFDGKVVWMTLLDAGDQTQSLYELQRQIHAALYEDLFNQEATKYLQTLEERGSMTQRQAMENELFRIAAERYLIIEGAATAPR